MNAILTYPLLYSHTHIHMYTIFTFRAKISRVGPVQNLVSASNRRREMSTSKKASLDVLVSHSPNKTLNTTVHKKSTHTENTYTSIRIIPLPKLAVIRTLNHQGHTLLSSPSAVDEEERITLALKMNGYPRKPIEYQLQSTQPQPSQDVTSPNPTFITSPM